MGTEKKFFPTPPFLGAKNFFLTSNASKQTNNFVKSVLLKIRERRDIQNYARCFLF